MYNFSTNFEKLSSRLHLGKNQPSGRNVKCLNIVEDPDQMAEAETETAAAAAAAKSIKVVCGNSAKLMTVKEYLKSEEFALQVRMENQANSSKNNQ